MRTRAPKVRLTSGSVTLTVGWMPAFAGMTLEVERAACFWQSVIPVLRARAANDDWPNVPGQARDDVGRGSGQGSCQVSGPLRSCIRWKTQGTANDKA